MRRGPPQRLLDVADASAPTAVLCEPTSGAVVLGSSQSQGEVDAERCAAAGLEVLRRRSGGGAVIVRPGAQLWLDVFVPRSDPRFSEDVRASFRFLGTAWRAALASVAVPPPTSLSVVDGDDVVTTKWSRSLCFAGLGSGEVSLDGHKVVGISQRRDRAGAWFHSMAMLDFDPLALPRLLVLTEADQSEAGAFLATAASAVPGGRTAGPSLVSALLRHLG